MKSQFSIIFIAILNVVCCYPSPSESGQYENIVFPSESISPPESIQKNNFPEVEYPTKVLDTMEPHYYREGNDDILAPFGNEVKNAFNSLNVEREVKDTQFKLQKSSDDAVQVRKDPNSESNVERPESTNSESISEVLEVPGDTKNEANVEVPEVPGDTNNDENENTLVESKDAYNEANEVILADPEDTNDEENEEILAEPQDTNNEENEEILAEPEDTNNEENAEILVEPEDTKNEEIEEILAETNEAEDTNNKGNVSEANEGTSE